MRKVLKALLLTILAYLFQVCAMNQLKIGGVVANLLAVNIAILTVSLGKKYAFGASCITGILLEVMTSTVGGFYAVIYPAISMLFAQLFSDMSDEKREIRRNHEKSTHDVNPHIRIPLNAMCISAGIETILLTYLTLSGAELSVRLIARALLSVVYTGALAVVLMLPVRAFLRMYGGRVKRALVEGEQE